MVNLREDATLLEARARIAGLEQINAGYLDELATAQVANARYRAALENIAVGQYPGQFKHESDPYSAYAHAVLEGPADA